MSKSVNLLKLLVNALGLGKKPNIFLLLFSLSWGFLNLLIGLTVATFCVLALGATVERFKEIVLVSCPNFKGCFGMTLGQIVICGDNLDEITLKHEYGHFKQSLILGPFYLLLVGLPSFTRASFFCLKSSSQDAAEYFYFYTEAWADYLGGIYAQRKHKHANWWNYLFLVKM